MTTPLSILTRDRALLGIAGSSTEYITECAEVSRGVSCWRCPSVLLPTAGCWMNAVDAVGLIQISTGAAAQRVRQWTHPPRTSLFRAGCSVWTERSLIDCWRITCPSTPRRLINLNIYSRKSSSNSLHKKYWLFFNLIHERIMESARQRFEWLQYRHLTLSLKISVHVRRPFSAAFSDLTLLGSRKGIRPVKTEWWLSVCSEVQTCIWPTWCHCHLLSVASVKSRLVLPFVYRLTRVVLDKGPLNGCVCVLFIILLQYFRPNSWPYIPET